MKEQKLKLKYRDFVVIKSKIFGFMAIFEPFKNYFAIEVRSPNLVANIYKGFPTRSWSLARFWVKMYLWRTIYDNTHLDAFSKNSKKKRLRRRRKNRPTIPVFKSTFSNRPCLLIPNDLFAFGKKIGWEKIVCAVLPQFGHQCWIFAKKWNCAKMAPQMFLKLLV